MTDLLGIGLRPTIAGVVVLVIGAIAGWGMAAQGAFLPVRLVRFWVEGVILRVLRGRWWSARAAVIFANNASVCALLVVAGGWPGGAWIGVTVVGLCMGMAVRSLGETLDVDAAEAHLAEGEVAGGGGVDWPLRVGVLLNLIEIPAIIVTLALCMGQLAAPNGLESVQIWVVFVVWVVPALLVAAGGEALWIGRCRSFVSPE